MKTNLLDFEKPNVFAVKNILISTMDKGNNTLIMDIMTNTTRRANSRGNGVFILFNY